MADIISQSKIFVDFGATTPAAGAVGLPGGAIWLQNVTKVQVTDDRSVEVVKAIGKKRGAGFRRKAGGGKLMVSENRHTPPQCDWRKLKRDEKVFMMMAQDENGGMREKWLQCTVSKVDRSLSDEGEHTDEIEIVFLDSV